MDPDTPLRSVKYQKNTPKITPCSSHRKKSKPAPTARKNLGKSVEFGASVKEANIMDHDDPIPKKNI